MPARELAPGDTIGPFVIDQQLARHEGNMAKIYKAHTANGRSPVVVKLAREGSNDYEALKSEEEALTLLHHPHIVRLLAIPLQTASHREYYLARAVDQPDRPWYMCLEYLEGGTLRERLQKKRTVPLDEAVEWTVQIGQALQYMMTQGMVHLDVKPENIMFRHPLSKGPMEAVLIDFGIAKRPNQKAPKAGSLPYVAPERLRHAEGADVLIDSRADLYSLGLVLYEMICGHVPFDGDPRTITEAIRSKTAPKPSEKLPGLKIPTAVEDLVMSTLAKLPGERVSLSDFLTRLDQEVPHRHIKPEREPLRIPPKVKLIAVVAILIVLAAAAGFAAAIIFQQILGQQILTLGR